MDDFFTIPSLGAKFFAGFIKHGIAGAEYRQRAFLAVENDIGPLCGGFGWEVTRETLLGDRSMPIQFERYDLRVGSFLIVVVTVATACRLDSNRQRRVPSGRHPSRARHCCLARHCPSPRTSANYSARSCREMVFVAQAPARDPSSDGATRPLPCRGRLTADVVARRICRREHTVDDSEARIMVGPLW